MNISVIISSYRGNEALARDCVASLELQTHLPYEVILVVDTPDERNVFSRALTGNRKILLKVISSGKKGLAAARNYGVEASSGEIIAFIDDDATADPNWLSEIERSFLANPDSVVVGGPVKPVFEGKPIDEKWNWIIGCTSRYPQTERPIGCNMAISRSVFDTIGGFDETLGRMKKQLSIGEETDLFLRIQEKMAGSRVICNSSAVVFHQVPMRRKTLRYMMRRAYQEGMGKAAMGKKHSLSTEKTFLGYYITHPDRYTVPLLLATGMGFIKRFTLK
jgi:GT2 family glycosyltransferase